MKKFKYRMALVASFACLSWCLTAEEPIENQVPSKKVSPQERFELEIEALKEDIVTGIESTFSEYDTDENGKLSWEEYREIYVLRAEVIRKRIKQLEADNLEVPEELTIRLRRAESDNPGVPEENELKKEFYEIDTDEDEHLTTEELTNHRIEQVDQRLQMRLQQELDAKEAEPEEVREE